MPAETEKYMIPHHLDGERARLRLMGGYLDPLSRRHIEALGLRPGWRCLEVAAGLGTISEWLAQRLAPTGHVICSDLETSLLDGLANANLEVRPLDLTTDALPTGCDLVFARAVLHHLRRRWEVLPRLVEALAPGGALLVIEPDFGPVAELEDADLRRFWEGFVAWAASVGIDYSVGRALPARCAALGLERVGAEATTAIFNGGSPVAWYWLRGMRELRSGMVEGGFVPPELFETLETRFADPAFWTRVCTFTAAWGWKPLA
jgi:SAM-dependent methyltransferase